jgi:hypothetical protein
MKLTIALAAAHIILRFTTPQAGHYTVFTGTGANARIVASNHEASAVHVAVRLPALKTNETFWVWFKPDHMPKWLGSSEQSGESLSPSLPSLNPRWPGKENTEERGRDRN